MVFQFTRASLSGNKDISDTIYYIDLITKGWQVNNTYCNSGQFIKLINHGEKDKTKQTSVVTPPSQHGKIAPQSTVSIISLLPYKKVKKT